MTHAHGQSRESAVQQVGAERMQQASGHRANTAQRLRGVLAARDDSRDHVTVSAEVLRGAVQRHGRSEIDRILQHGCREGVVHHDGDRARQSHDVRDVRDVEGRVRRRLDDDQSGVGAQRQGDLVGVAVRRLHAKQARAEQMIGAAVERTHGDDVPCPGRTGVGEDDRGHGRHAGGEGDSGLRVLQLGERLLEARDRRVPQPRVDHAAVGGRASARGHRLIGVPAPLDVRQRVRRGEVDRQRVDSETCEVGTSAVDGHGVGMQRCSHASTLPESRFRRRSSTEVAARSRRNAILCSIWAAKEHHVGETTTR